MDVYPNPFGNQIQLEFDLVNDEKSTVAIYDLNGKLIISQDYSGKKGLNKFSMNLENQVSGVYFVKVQIGSDIIQKRIIKQ